MALILARILLPVCCAFPRGWRRSPGPGETYLSPHGTTFIPAGRDFVTWASAWGVRSADLLRAFGRAAADAAGRVFLTAGHILVYSPEGRLLETPERPAQIAFGGRNGRTLFICARSSLYSVRLKTPGR